MIHGDKPLFTLLSKIIPITTIPKNVSYRTMHSTVVVRTDNPPLSLKLPIQFYKSPSSIVECEQPVEVMSEHQQNDLNPHYTP